jgi:hypothetical protein
VKHAGPAALETLGPLLTQLRTVDGLVEKKTGTFSWRSKAFLHFHEDDSGLYVDARFDPDGDFERQRVTTAAEQRRFIRAVRAAVGRT